MAGGRAPRRAVREHGPAVAGGIDLDLPGDRVRLRATRWPGQGMPVVLLHGLASTRRFWNLVAAEPALAAHYVVAIDARGHGESDAPDAAYDLTTVAGDVATALDALAISRAVVVGHSWGGAVATTFAAEHPHRALAVVAIDGGFTPAVGAEELAGLRERLSPPEIDADPAELADRLRGGALAAYWDDERERAVLSLFAVGDDGRARARLPRELHMRALDGLLSYDAAATFALIGCPAWLVDCEPAPPPEPGSQQAAWAERKRQGLDLASAVLPRPRAMQWAGALHDVPLQWPAAVAGVVRAAADEVARAVPPASRREASA